MSRRSGDQQLAAGWPGLRWKAWSVRFSFSFLSSPVALSSPDGARVASAVSPVVVVVVDVVVLVVSAVVVVVACRRLRGGSRSLACVCARRSSVFAQVIQIACDSGRACFRTFASVHVLSSSSASVFRHSCPFAGTHAQHTHRPPHQDQAKPQKYQPPAPCRLAALLSITKEMHRHVDPHYSLTDVVPRCDRSLSVRVKQSNHFSILLNNHLRFD